METGLGNPLIDSYKERVKATEERHKREIKWSNGLQVTITALCLGGIYILNRWLESLGTLDDVAIFLLTMPLSVPVLGAGWIFGRRASSKKMIETPTDYDFSGKWKMICKFHEPLLNDKSNFAVNNRELILSSFKDRVEVGVTRWEQDEYGVNISCDKAFASKIITDEEAKAYQEEDIIEIKGQKYVEDENNKTIVRFQSDLASFDHKQIRWVFAARVEWPDVAAVNHKFKGVEEYTIERGRDGKPNFLCGELLGCIDVDGWQFILSAESQFIKCDEDKKSEEKPVGFWGRLLKVRITCEC